MESNAVIRAYRKNPGQIPTREALADGARIHIDGDDLVNQQLQAS